MWFNKTEEELEQELETNIEQGLTTEQAQAKLKKNGKNELVKTKNRHWSLIFLLALIEPLSLILIVAGVISIVVERIINQHIDFIDFIVIMTIVIINALIQTIQQMKARKSLEALQQLTIPMAVVKRDGEIVEIPAVELVVGDVVILEAGKYIPADIRLVEASNLQIDESALTGESVPVEKNSKIINKDKLVLAEQHNIAFMSTFITNGRAIGVVVANAVDSEIGKIAKSVSETKQNKTPLQLRLAKLTKWVSAFAVILAIAVFVFFYFMDENDWPVNMMTSVTIAIAVIPESLMVIVSVILSLSTKRMSNVNVIVKKLDAVETLGSVNIICSDKTGTLTQNKMTVKEVIFDNNILKTTAYKYHKDSPHHQHFINCLTLCNDAINEKKEKIGDPTEIALVDFTRAITIRETEWRKKYKRVDEIPFDSDRKLMTTVNKVNSKKIVYTKGAIDQLLEHCTKIYLDEKIIPLTAELKKIVHAEAMKLSHEALRVLAFAFKEQDDSPLESDLIFLGAVGMIDPPRPEAIVAIEKAHHAGIRVVMITGDHKVTAFAIAQQLKIVDSEENVMSGHQIDSIDNDQLKEKLKTMNVFARVNPEHKTRIVECLQELNYVVSMTGDGVNDAPSLSKADIGVAMGITGTDVSKEAANIILQDDNFSTIIKGVEEGRNVYQKIKRAIIFVISANIAQVLAFLLISIITTIKPFESVNILWFNLIIETLLAIPIGLDHNDGSLMLDKPRNKKESFFSHELLTLFFISFITAASVIAAFFIGREVFDSNADAKIAAVLVMTCAPAIYVYAIRLPNYKIKYHQKHKLNYYLLGSILLTLVLNFMIVYIPGLNQIFLNDPTGMIYSTPPILSWQMSLVSLAMMCVPLVGIILYGQIRHLIKR
ncbi:cation-translocating P-type ATPase [Spiroplasma sp. DGKH1]|uniref:cation-translocating P-type ATPase n=1 Tax=Spiroplasma sp. DGKH1 TaxID=3050074 RepID=UPI0034C5CDEB